MRIAITSPERLFLDALVSLFAGTNSHIVAGGTECRASILKAREEQADVLIVDMHGATLQDLQFLLGAQAFADFQTVLILDKGQALPDGFSLGINRTDSSKELIALIEPIASKLIVKQVGRGRGRPRMITKGHPLSEREYEVACLIAKGYINRTIAETLNLKEQSVKNLVSTVIRKLRCENRVQVALQFKLDVA